MKDFQGAIKNISAVTQVGTKQMDKLEFVLEETDGEYPQSMSITLLGDKVKLIDGYNKGDVVKASLNFKANAYKDRYFTNINARKIDTISKGQGQAAAPVKDDDLPF